MGELPFMGSPGRPSASGFNDPNLLGQRGFGTGDKAMTNPKKKKGLNGQFLGNLMGAGFGQTFNTNFGEGFR
jgi:hypothetical protein